MSDDFGTVNVRRGERAREIELLRQHYRQHRDALGRMTSEAPTDYLASEYQRLIREIDNALAKLDELEGRNSTATTPVPPIPSVEPKTEPGARHLITPSADSVPSSYEPVPTGTPGSGPRVAMIVVAAVIVLAIIGWLIYRASGDRRTATTDTATTSITESTTAPVTSTAPGTIEPVQTQTTNTAPAGAAALTIRPALLDYATIHKGTRATRQIEVTNPTGAPVAFKVSRSQCKCLFYEYRDTVAPNKKETVTVTVDGARAKAGTLQETVEITGKKDNAPLASFQVVANIK